MSDDTELVPDDTEEDVPESDYLTREQAEEDDTIDINETE